MIYAVINFNINKYCERHTYITAQGKFKVGGDEEQHPVCDISVYKQYTAGLSLQLACVQRS